MKSLFLSLTVSCFLFACTIVPETIDVADSERLTEFKQVKDSNNIAAVLGSKARWGGKIVSVENKQDVSEIEIVFFPENHYGKPKLGDPSEGRFKAVVKGFVDPLVFESGRIITVVGEVGQYQTGIIGEQEYTYPVLNAMGYHMWKQTSQVEVDTFGIAPFGFYSGYHHSFFTPWYNPWYYNTRKTRFRVISKNGHQQGGRVTNPSSRNVYSNPPRDSNSRGQIERRDSNNREVQKY